MKSRDISVVTLKSKTTTQTISYFKKIVSLFKLKINSVHKTCIGLSHQLYLRKHFRYEKIHAFNNFNYWFNGLSK